MSLARSGRWVQRALVLGLLLLVANSLLAPVTVRLTTDGQAPSAQPAAVAAATWPVSTGMLVSEVVTRGAAASDQYVELYNASSGVIDLAGLELVYVTASGLTVTRKQTWTALVVPSHAHLLIANASGTYSATADGLFSNGGFSTSGGALVLRAVAGGAVIDSLAWGSAANTFVEGTPGAAPPTGSSLERKPGGILGNVTDSNDNLADTRLEPAPVAQNLSSAPVPAPTATATASPTFQATATPVVSAEPTATPTPEPTMTIAPTDSPAVTPEPTPSPTLGPTPAPTAEPTTPPTVPPTATPTVPPTPLPTPTPSAAPLTVNDARLLPLGSITTVAARLTTQPGLTESGRGAFAQDATGGLALYLASGEWPLLDIGADIVVTGTLETRYSLLTLRLADASAIAVSGIGPSPLAMAMLTGEVGELVESQLVTVQATVSDGIATLSDGFSTAVDDGSGALRVIVAAAAGISADSLARGTLVQLTGVVGQRDTSGTGLAGYRLHLRSAADVVPLASPTPTPSPTLEPTAQPTPEPSAGPTAAPTATVAPTTTPTPSPAVMTIAAARALAVGQTATIQGTVTVEPGRLPDGTLIAVQDATGGICVQLPADISAVSRGDVVLVTGTLAAPYGNLELRPAAAAALSVVGSAGVPAPAVLTAAQVGEPNEGLLATIAGTLTQIDSTTTSLTLFVDDGAGEARVFITADLGIVRADFVLGSQLTVTGLVADRLGLYRIWPRDRADIVAVAPPSPAPSPTAGPTAPPTPTAAPSASIPPSAPEVMAIAGALRHIGETIAITATVTSPTGLLDADGRRVTVEDSSGAVLVRLPESTSVRVGDRLLLVGEMGTYYGAPQLAAGDAPVPVAGGKAITPTVVKAAPLPTKNEWRLVSVSGGVTALTRDGDAWHAELSVSGGSIPIDGFARSGIPATALVVGRTATVIGIVKRAYPTASDQRLAVVPRSAADISLGGSAAKGNQVFSGATDGRAGNGAASDDVRPGAPAAAVGTPRQIQAISLADIASHENELVIVGGRLDAIDGDRLLVNDGTSLAAIRVPATAGLGPLRVGALVNARGSVSRTAQGGVEIVVASVDDVRILDAVMSVAGPSPAAFDARLDASTSERPAVIHSAPANAMVAFAIGGLLALALGVGAAGIVIARRPDLLNAAVRALASLRVHK